ncbi:MAG: S-methyl-5-thioribose-1-phosphate isomerase [Chloroflexi bacterium]|nr:S-methyl-5-thioribose-1-phosphate isomerase [Chloroflexota bacterium]
MKDQKTLYAIEWTGDNCVCFLRQDLLPSTIEYVTTADYTVLCKSIKDLQVRGAPVIGITAAYAMALAALHTDSLDYSYFEKQLHTIAIGINATRPTAKNLSYALERMQKVIADCQNVPAARQALIEQARQIAQEEENHCASIAHNGAAVIPQGTVMTYCNAGPLACSGIGTALGVIAQAYKQQKVTGVIVNETRPLLQGARITALELKNMGIPYRLITDNTAAYIMCHGLVDSIVVGADRIARNGDTANKIGTYNLAVLARTHNIPFYVTAPSSTFDADAESKDDIVIEERAAQEVTSFYGIPTAPDTTKVYNPAFDVTPADFITAIISEKGVFYPPYSF